MGWSLESVYDLPSGKIKRPVKDVKSIELRIIEEEYICPDRELRKMIGTDRSCLPRFRHCPPSFSLVSLPYSRSILSNRAGNYTPGLAIVGLADHRRGVP